MNWSDFQRSVVFLTVMIIIAMGVYAYGLLDLRDLVATLIGEGVVSFLVFLLLRERAMNIGQAKMIEARKAFRKWFYFFPSKWLRYEELIETVNIGKPEIEQPNTIADQLRFSFRDAQSVGFKFNSEVKETIEKIIDNLDRFGFDLRKTMDTAGLRQEYLMEVMKGFKERGRTIVRAIEDASEDVERSLEMK